jgi:hypothetical protein
MSLTGAMLTAGRIETTLFPKMEILLLLRQDGI